MEPILQIRGSAPYCREAWDLSRKRCPLGQRQFQRIIKNWPKLADILINMCYVVAMNPNISRQSFSFIRVPPCVVDPQGFPGVRGALFFLAHSRKASRTSTTWPEGTGLVLVWSSGGLLIRSW